MEISKDNTAIKQPAAQLQALKKYEGRWVIEGNNAGDAPENPGSTITGTMTNEWLKGNFFMCTNWNYQFAKGEHTGAGFFGFNEQTNNFFSVGYDNMGFERRYEITLYKNTWNINGELERATLVFNDDGSQYEENWEIMKGDGWKPLCTRIGKKQA